MSGIEALIIFPMTAFHFAIMPRSIGPYHFMSDAVMLQMNLKQGRPVPVCSKPVGEFGSIVCLDALNRAGKGFDKMVNKQGGGISVVLLKGFHIAPSGILVNSSILEKLFSNDPAVDKAGRRDEFHIYLDTLSGMIHLLIRFWDVFRVGRMEGSHVLFLEETVKTRNRAGITTLHKFYPKDDQTCIRVTPAHIRDQSDLLRSVLVRMVVRSAGEVAQGLNRAVKASFPTINILPVGLVFDGSLSDAIFVGIID